jgi:hypothetical protein
VNDQCNSARIGMRDVVASWLVCLALVLFAFVSLGDRTRGPQPEQVLAPSAAATAPEYFSNGANKAPSSPVSMAVGHC